MGIKFGFHVIFGQNLTVLLGMPHFDCFYGDRTRLEFESTCFSAAGLTRLILSPAAVFPGSIYQSSTEAKNQQMV
jgi:hypothetical protein